jgi:hypothetical protein
MKIMRVIEAELYSLDGILPGASEFMARYAHYKPYQEHQMGDHG